MKIRILSVDVGSRTYKYLEDGRLRRTAIGGLGINTFMLYFNTPPGIDPLGSANHLFLSPGALVGTNVPTASRCEMTALSPLTNGFGSSSSGGTLSMAIRYCGVDCLWLKGRSTAPIYLVIDDEGVTFKDASYLWGQDTHYTLDLLKEEEGEETEIACIGVAGERLVRFASVLNGYHQLFGRTGLGAVMGSKNVKAIVFSGGGEVVPVNGKAFLKVSKQLLNKVCSSAAFGYTRKYGSMIVSDAHNKLGILPGRNFRQGSISNWNTTRGRKAFVDNYKVRSLACFACPIGCMGWVRATGGRWAGLEAKGFEVTVVLEFGAKLGLVDMVEILACQEACNSYGLDALSTAGVIAYAIELYEKGFLDNVRIELPPSYGDFESIYSLIGLIGERKGIGAPLGEGTKRAKRFFPGSEYFAIEIKGLEMPARDPRGNFDAGILGYLTNPRGGDHLRMRTPVDNLTKANTDYEYEILSATSEEIASLDMPEKIKSLVFGDPPAYIQISSKVKYGEDLLVLFNSFGICIRPPVLKSIGPSLLCEAFNTLFGCDIRETELMQIAENIFTMQHIINLRSGITIDDFRFPQRFYQEDLALDDREPLNEKKLANCLKEYFMLRGWRQDGIPKKETIADLELQREK